MSAKVEGKTIYLTRGDSLLINTVPTVDGLRYVPKSGDQIRFALKQDTSDGEPLIYKQADMTTMRVMLEPTDTKSLEYGTYSYDVELITANGFVSTFIGPEKFIITEEVY